MGVFFTNYQILSDATDAVREAAGPLIQRRAYIAPAKGRWTTLYDETSDSQDENILRRTAMGLSRKLSTAVFAFLVHDSDLLVYFLYERGQLVDEFNSDPDYHGSDKAAATSSHNRGDTDAVLPYCLPATTREQLDAVLHPDPKASFGEGMLQQLAALLGIDPQRACTSFTYIDEEGAEALADAAELVPVGKNAKKPRKRPRPRPKPAAAASPAGAGDMLEPYPFAIGTLATLEVERAAWSGTPEGLRMLEAQSHRAARELMANSRLAQAPSVDEQIAAFAAGPAAVAELVATRTPALLDTITDVVSRGGEAALVEALLDRGANPLALNPFGQTLLMSSTAIKSPALLRRLLAAGVDVNAKDNHGSTAVARAVQMRNPPAARLLREAGATD